MYIYPQSFNIPLKGLDRCALTVGEISGPTAKLEPSFGTILPVVYLHGQSQSGKADQSTLASRGSEHAYLFSVTLSCGNKMNS